MHVIVSRVLLGASILSLAACVILGVDVIQSYQRAVAKDDFVGFSLGTHFLVYVLVPLTLSLVAAACLLDPPTWLLEQLGIGKSPAERPGSILRPTIVSFCLVAAAVIFLRVVTFVGGNLVSAAQHYDYGTLGLAAVFLQNLVFSAPLLTLGVLLAWAGQALKRRGSTA